MKEIIKILRYGHDDDARTILDLLIKLGVGILIIGALIVWFIALVN